MLSYLFQLGICNIRSKSLLNSKRLIQTLIINNKAYETDGCTNVTESILNKIPAKLYLRENHPLSLLRLKIKEFYNGFTDLQDQGTLEVFENMPVAVTTVQNFDSLLVPESHPSRSLNDNYHINSTHLLRAHTTCHYADLFIHGAKDFMIFGDVYRRDQIDKYHYPVFHQMDFVKLYHSKTFGNVDRIPFIIGKLKYNFESLFKYLLGDKIKTRWVDAYFPFTDPSFELEIDFSADSDAQKWTEVLGCGMIRQEILDRCNLKEYSGYACGVGLDRIVMKKFNIPDIRYLWTADERFISQFINDGWNTEFKPYSKYPKTWKDVSFWKNDCFDENSFNDVIRSIGGDLVEDVCLIDQYSHPETKKLSSCYRITYRSMDRNLTDYEVNCIQNDIIKTLQTKYSLDIRV